jgi:hypothetical protein
LEEGSNGNLESRNSMFNPIRKRRTHFLRNPQATLTGLPAAEEIVLDSTLAPSSHVERRQLGDLKAKR